MIRNAKFEDIPAIIELLHDAFSRSHYAKEKVGAIDVKEAKRLLLQSIQRHGYSHGGACWVQVAESHGIITGLILGTLVRVCVIGDKLMATDLFWIASNIVEPGDPYALMKGMINWAKSCPEVVEVKCGSTAIIRDNPEEAAAVLKRLGLKRYGVIYREAIR